MRSSHRRVRSLGGVRGVRERPWGESDERGHGAVLGLMVLLPCHFILGVI
jgi:hypothetical protein